MERVATWAREHRVEVLLPDAYPDEPERDPRRDFAGVVRGAPACVLRPADVDTLAATLRMLADEGQPYRLRGAGWSSGGQVVADGGVVVELTRLDRVVGDGDDEITVEGGATWLAVCDRLREHGRRPLVVADNLFMTVGGTLAAGGLGDTSSVHGPTFAQVTRLVLVTPDGAIRRLAPGDRLFHHALGGAGTTGAIAEATLRTMRRPRTLVSRTLAWAKTDEYCAEAAVNSEQRLYEIYQGSLSWNPDGSTLVHMLAGNLADAAEPGEPGLWELKPNAITAATVSDRYASLRSARTPWNALRPSLQVSVPVAFAGEVLRQLTEFARAEPLLRAGMPRVGLLPHRTDARFPVAPQPAAPVALAIVLRPQVADAAEAIRLLRVIGTRALEVGRIGHTSIDLGVADLAERQLGPVLGELRSLRAEVDPAGLCNRGVLPGLDHS